MREWFGNVKLTDNIQLRLEQTHVDKQVKCYLLHWFNNWAFVDLEFSVVTLRDKVSQTNYLS